MICVRSSWGLEVSCAVLVCDFECETRADGVLGNIANVGVHGTGVNLRIDKLWPRSTSKYSIDLTGEKVEADGLCSDLHGAGVVLHNSDVAGSDVGWEIGHKCFDYTWRVSRLLTLRPDNDDSANGLVDFKFSEIEKAYDIFGRAAETKALKVNIEFD